MKDPQPNSDEAAATTGETSLEKADRVRQALVKAPDLVRVESSVDRMPIWAPSRYADERKREYTLKWHGENAGVTVQAAGEYGMLRSFDKLVLTALVHLWNEQKTRDDGHVYFQIIDIINALERTHDGKTYEQIKQSLHRLRGCMLQYRMSFFDHAEQEWVSLRDKNILSDLLIVEPRKEEGAGVQLALSGLTFAQLDFMVVVNLLGDFTRPVSLRLLQSLSERGILFESYVNGVLYRNPRVLKDVFELWHDLGLSTAGIKYGSQLASRMRKDLDKIAAHPDSFLGSYSFEKSKGKARSQNLILVRKDGAEITIPNIPTGHRTSDTPQRRVKGKTGAQIDQLVEWMRFELHDESPNSTNLQVIAKRMPEDVIRKHVNEAFASYRDGKTRNPTAYFVGIMNRVAGEMGIDLGFDDKKSKQGGKKSAPKPLNLRREGSGLQSLADVLDTSDD